MVWFADRFGSSWWSVWAVVLVVVLPVAVRAGDEAGPASLRGEVTLEDAVAAAMAGAPELTGAPSELAIRDAEAAQAAARPNPELVLEEENFAGTGSSRAWREAETTLAVAVPIELGDERSRRVEVAQLDRRLAEWDQREQRQTVRLATAEAFVRTLAAQERLAWARQAVALESALGEAVERGLRAGAVSAVDARRASLARKRAEADVDHRLRELAAARLALARSWGERTPAFDRVRGDLARLAPPPPLDELLGKVGELPSVSRWHDQQARDRASLALEDARAAPDLRVGVGVRHLAADDDVALVASVGVALPLFDRNQGAIAVARRSAERSAALGGGALVDGAAALRALHHEASASHDRAQTLLGSLVPEAEAVHREAREAYQRGLFRLTDVLETQRSLLELRLELIDELERHHRAATALRITCREGDSR